MFCLPFLLLACTQEWVNVEALPSTPPDPTRVARKAALLDELVRLGGAGEVLLGQQLGHAGMDAYWDPDAFTGLAEAPVVMGADIGDGAWDNDVAPFLALAEAHAAEGGLVTASASLANPSSRGGVKSRGVDWDALLGDSAAHDRWEITKTRIGNTLQLLEDRDVLVLWRPLHEVNGDWFWWSTASPEQYEALWRDLFTTLVEERELDNLLWVYAPNMANSDAVRAVDLYYPGADVVDVTGLDYYGDDPAGLAEVGLDTLRALGHPVAATELGPAFWEDTGAYDARRWDVLPSLGISYALAWSSWGDKRMSIRDMPNGDALLDTPGLTTLEDWP